MKSDKLRNEAIVVDMRVSRQIPAARLEDLVWNALDAYRKEHPKKFVGITLLSSYSFFDE